MKPYTITIVVSIEYDDGGYISSVVIARGSNKDPYTYSLRYYNLRSENIVLKDTTQQILDNSLKAAVVRNYLRYNYSYIGGREAKY